MAQITAALISTNFGYLLLTFLPPILWLLFYLQEDRHPEPKHLLALAFIGGVFSAGLAVIVELFLIGEHGGVFSGYFSLQERVFGFFLIIGLVEEYVKYLPIKFLILKRLDFNEPVDGMIYMMTSALGFAAIENALFVFPLFRENLFIGLEVATNRFLGANLLHALCSGIVGFFLARAFFRPWRHHFVAIGIIIATLLHATFNYLILVREVLPEGTFYLILLLSIMAAMVLIDFERLKNLPPQQESPVPNPEGSEL